MGRWEVGGGRWKEEVVNNENTLWQKLSIRRSSRACWVGVADEGVVVAEAIHT